MALTSTTLSSDLGASDTTVKLTSTTGFAAGQPMQVDGEYMVVVSVPSTTTVKVRSRGNQGTAGVAHDVLAAVVTSADASDFPVPPAGAVSIRQPFDSVVSYGEDGAIGVPTKNTFVILTKGSAGAYTLAAPSKAIDGLTLTITTRTAFAHVITATTLIGDGVTGSPHTTVTFAAFIGASIILVASNGLWVEAGVKGVTVT
jgi:hypothetical protein